MTPKSACIPRELQLEAAMFRLGKVDDEIHAGYEILCKYHKTVTIFGSARVKPDSEYYQKAVQLGAMLAKNGYTIITGGGGGIMEAANRGAIEAGGQSVGFNIRLPHEQSLNPYTTDSFAFTHFAPRKIVMTLMADAYVCFPGGFGTMDEIAEIITLVQTKKMTQVPVILFDKKFWGKWDIFVRENMLSSNQLISEGDENVYTITEDLDEIVNVIKNSKICCDN